MHIIELGKLAVPEESVASATVDAFDVHAQGHDDLVITVRAHVVFDAHFNCLVRDLDHLEVVLHLLLEQLVVQNHDSVGLHCAQNAVAAAPGQVGDGLLSGLDGREGLPARVIDRARSAHYLALPHNDVAILGAG